MTEEDNLLLGVLGAGAALVLAFLGMNTQKANTAAQGSVAPPKMKTGCGCQGK